MSESIITGNLTVYGDIILAEDNSDQHGTGIYGHSVDGVGAQGESDTGTGVYGSSKGTGLGVYGHSVGGIGTEGASDAGTGVYATGGTLGVFAQSDNVGGQFHCTKSGNDVFLSESDKAAWFNGDITVTGHITKSATMFKIDHPQEPAKKYLSHSAVESSEMKNIYDGIVSLDTKGEAEVVLPVWFEALNINFRYQLTCIGGYAPVYIAQEVQGNRFKIAGGRSDIKVSWQITGIRQDAWAKAHPIQVEEDKSAEEQGYYFHPELHGEPEEKNIMRVRYPHSLSSSHTSPAMPK